MSEHTPEESAASAAAKMLAEAQQMLAQAKDMRLQIEQHLHAADSARKNADEHATYAFQAKSNTEEHSKAAAVFRGNAEGMSNAVTTNKQNFDQLVATTNQNKATIEENMKVIGEARKSIEQYNIDLSSALIKGLANLQKLEETKTAIESAQATTSQADIAAKQAKERAEKVATDISKSENEVAARLVTIASQSESIDKTASNIATILATAEGGKTSIAAILERLQSSDKTATEHEGQVKELAGKLGELNRTAERLLPDMTSTSLAHSFNLQKSRFVEPQRRWLMTFQGCIIALIIIAAPSFFLAVFGILFQVRTDTEWEEILRGMLVKLPIVIPLVWLAIYAGRNYMLSLRLEEEYAYKEALSRAFEGYKREMKEIQAGDVNNPTPLVRFCQHVLSALAERPGRIYEGKQKAYTVLNELQDAMEKTNELRNRRVAN